MMADWTTPIITSQVSKKPVYVLDVVLSTVYPYLMRGEGGVRGGKGSKVSFDGSALYQVQLVSMLPQGTRELYIWLICVCRS